MGLLDMMLHIADENAKDARARSFSIRRQVEDREWENFKSKLRQQREALKVGEHELDAIEEDDIDILLVLVEVLERATAPLTVAEIVRLLQHRKVLSLEFTATAREQTKRLLTTMQELNRVVRDQRGCWSWRAAR